MLVFFTISAIYVSISVFYIILSAKHKLASIQKFRKNMYLTIAYVLCAWVVTLYILQLGWERGLAVFLSAFAVMGPVVLLSELILKDRWVKTVPFLTGLAILTGGIVSVGMLL